MVSLLGSLQSIPAPWHYAAAFVGVTACVHGWPSSSVVALQTQLLPRGGDACGIGAD